MSGACVEVKAKARGMVTETTPQSAIATSLCCNEPSAMMALRKPAAVSRQLKAVPASPETGR